MDDKDVSTEVSTWARAAGSPVEPIKSGGRLTTFAGR